MIYAIIDIGSNTIRLSVFKAEEGDVINLFNVKESASLRTYLKKGTLTKNGVDRLVSTLKEFKNLIDNFDDIDKVFPFATATIRDSANRVEILSRVKEEVGYDIEILSAEDESSLAFLGANSTIEIKRGVLTDIGGGSSEVVIIGQSKVLKSTSIDIGSLSAFNDCVERLFATKDEKKEIDELIKQKLADNKMYREEHEILSAVGGSARASLKLYNEYYNLDSSNFSMDAGQFNTMVKEIIDLEDREKLDLILSVKADRIHTLIPGMIILNRICKYFYCKQINVSQTGVREGYLYSKILGKE
jgi:exopolyphosphatase/guanosine-5'-triphosphate,3'-diphosphate pyrophosphatase